MVVGDERCSALWREPEIWIPQQPLQLLRIWDGHSETRMGRSQHTAIMAERNVQQGHFTSSYSIPWQVRWRIRWRKFGQNVTEYQQLHMHLHPFAEVYQLDVLIVLQVCHRPGSYKLQLSPTLIFPCLISSYLTWSQLTLCSCANYFTSIMSWYHYIWHLRSKP